MADALEDIEVTVEEEPTLAEPEVEVVAAEPEVTPPAKPEPESKPAEVTPEEGIEQLKAKLAVSEAARQTAERQAAEQARAAAAAQGQTADARVQMVETALAQVKQQEEVFESQLAELWQAGDMAAAAKIQRQMGEATAKRLTLENGLEQLKNAPKPQPAPQPAPGNPVEEIAGNLLRGGSPRSAQWVRDHPQYVTDPNLNQRLVKAAEFAGTEGYNVDSPEYVARVEQLLGINMADRVTNGREQVPAQPAQRREAAPAAAPVSRGANGNGSGNPSRVTLTRDEREMAGNLFPDLSQTEAEKAYARNKLLLKAEGRLN